MQAAVLERFGSPLAVREVPDPVRRDGEVLLDVVATCVLPYSAEVFGGERRYPLEPPVIPGVGGIGRIAGIGPDATHLRVGDLVFCDATVRSRDDALTPDITLQGWSSRGEGGARLARLWHDGSFAQRMTVPTENVVALPSLSADDVARWAALAVYVVPYGGLVSIGLQPGETLAVSGATGNFGSAGVSVALAMGAARVIATGRNEGVLADLVRRFGARVVAVGLTGDETRDHEAILAAAGGRVDAVLDLLPPQAPAAAARTVAMTVREFGRVCLMGGVGLLGGEDLGLPYPWLMRNSITVRGRWMAERAAVPAVISLAGAGLLDLTQDEVITFGLARANDAVDHAAGHAGPFRRTVLEPSRV